MLHQLLPLSLLIWQYCHHDLHLSYDSSSRAVLHLEHTRNNAPAADGACPIAYPDHLHGALNFAGVEGVIGCKEASLS